MCGCVLTRVHVCVCVCVRVRVCVLDGVVNGKPQMELASAMAMGMNEWRENACVNGRRNSVRTVVRARAVPGGLAIEAVRVSRAEKAVPSAEAHLRIEGGREVVSGNVHIDGVAGNVLAGPPRAFERVGVKVFQRGHTLRQ